MFLQGSQGRFPPGSRGGDPWVCSEPPRSQHEVSRVAVAGLMSARSAPGEQQPGNSRGGGRASCCSTRVQGPEVEQAGRGWLEQADGSQSAAPGGGWAGRSPGLGEPPCWGFTQARCIPREQIAPCLPGLSLCAARVLLGIVIVLMKWPERARNLSGPCHLCLAGLGAGVRGGRMCQLGSGDGTGLTPREVPGLGTYGPCGIGAMSLPERSLTHASSRLCCQSGQQTRVGVHVLQPSRASTAPWAQPGSCTPLARAGGQLMGLPLLPGSSSQLPSNPQTSPCVPAPCRDVRHLRGGCSGLGTFLWTSKGCPQPWG